MILLDTHAVIWLLVAPEKLSGPARERILRARQDGEQIGFSPVSLYEITYAVQRERLRLHIPLQDFVTAIRAQLDLVPLSAEIAVCAGELPEPFDGDPMDRILAATAMIQDCPLISSDTKIRKAELCTVVW